MVQARLRKLATVVEITDIFLDVLTSAQPHKASLATSNYSLSFLKGYVVVDIT